MPRLVHPGRMARAVVLAGALAVIVAGCSPGAVGPSPTAVPSTSHAPVFASDADALKAAEEAYQRYLAAVDVATQSGGTDQGSLVDLVAPPYFTQLKESLARLEASGNHTSGATKFDQMRLIDRGDDMQFSAYACLDVTGVRVLSPSGTDVTPNTRMNRKPIVVSFLVAPAGSLLIAGSEKWSGENFC